MRWLLAALVVAVAGTPVSALPLFARASDALCVSWSGPPLLALPPAAQDAYLGALADAGWRLLRTDFTWAEIEPAPGQFDFTRYDALVALAAARGIEILGLLDYGNPWAADPGSPPGDDRFPPADPASFARFAAETASHFKGRVRAWEIWNEPNLLIFWKPAPDPARYALLAATAARAIRRADRRATVVLGGLAPTIDFVNYGEDWGFLTEAVRAQPRLLKRFRAAAFHPYTFLQAPPPEIDAHEIGPSIPHQITHFRQRLEESRAGHVPIWVTEFGWHTAPESGVVAFPPGVSELDQARFLVRATTLALAARVQKMCWYTATDYENFLHDKEAAFGLFRWETAGVPDPKPAYVAARTFAQVLGQGRFVRDLRRDLALPSDAYALCFQDRKVRRTVIVFWSLRPGVAAVMPVLGDRRTRLVTLDGQETDLGDVDEVSLTLDETPVYLVLDGLR